MNNFKISYVKVSGLHALYNQGVITSFNKVIIVSDDTLTLCDDNIHLCTLFEPAYSEFVDQLENFDVEVVRL